MTKTRIILLVGSVLVFAAGTSAGLLLSRVNDKPRRRSWLVSELNLTADQQEKMREIWSETLKSRLGSRGEDRRNLRQQRDEAIEQLLTAEQKVEYDAVQERYAQQIEQMHEQRRRAFEAATERTKRILTPEQVTKYEKILAQRREAGSSPQSRGGRPWGRRRRSRRDWDPENPATQTRPATRPGK